MIKLERHRSQSGYFNEILVGKVESITCNSGRVTDSEIKMIVRELEYAAQGHSPNAASIDYMELSRMTRRSSIPPVVIILNIQQQVGRGIDPQQWAGMEPDYSDLERQIRDSEEKKKKDKLLLLK